MDLFKGRRIVNVVAFGASDGFNERL